MSSLSQLTSSVSIQAIAGLTALWRETLGDPGVRIAVLDGPVDLSHPCFAGADLEVIDPLRKVRGSGTSPADHGTHITSEIFGQHDSPIRGVAPRCSGLVVPIFEEDYSGALLPSTQDELALAIESALENNANVINISAGQPLREEGTSPRLVGAVKRCEGRALVVAAAGNEGCRCLHVPGALPSVLAVGAMDVEGEPLSFSNWGDHYRENGILALGEDVEGAVADGGKITRSGTSFAAPIVSGVAALLMTLEAQAGVLPSPSKVKSIILKSSDACIADQAEDCSRFLAGRLNISRSVKQLKSRLNNMSATSDNFPPPVTSAVQPHASARQPSLTPSEASNVPDPAPTGTVSPAACSCQPKTIQNVYAIGEIGYDFGTEARRDSITHNMATINSTQRRLIPESRQDLARHLLGFTEYQVEALEGRITGSTDDPSFIEFSIDDTLSREDDGRFIVVTGVTGDDHPDFNDVPVPISVESGLTTRFKLRDDDGVFGSPPVGGFNVDRASFLLVRGVESKYKHRSNGYDARAIKWTLNRGLGPNYVVEPSGAFSEATYEELSGALLESRGYRRSSLDFFYTQTEAGISPWEKAWDPRSNTKKENGKYVLSSFKDESILDERISIPGVLGPTTTLLNGTRIPSVNPDLRGMAGWSQAEMLNLIFDSLSDRDRKRIEQLEGKREEVERKLLELLVRLDEEVRNPGISHQDRALNFAATQLHNSIIARIAKQVLIGEAPEFNPKYELEDILSPTRHDTCRQGAECWNVEIVFFNPQEIREARLVVRQTIDVSDVVPFTYEEPQIFRRR